MRAKIMVVDDERDMVDAAEMVLVMQGYEVVVAYDGDEALQKVEAEMPDLIFLDKVMPGISGIEVCKILKSQAKTKHIPILLFTASGGDLDELTVEAGADGYFQKPFAPEDLPREVGRRLDQASSRSHEQQKR